MGFADTWDTTTVTEGHHALTAQAVDGAGNLGPVGPPVTVLVDNDVHGHLNPEKIAEILRNYD